MAFMLGCSTAPIDQLWGHYVGVRVSPVEIAPDTCRIDMSVTNLKDRGSVRPGFEVQIISVEEWAEIPPDIRGAPSWNGEPYRSSSLYAFGQKEKILFDDIPVGQTAARHLKTLDMPCSSLGLYAFWLACDVGAGGNFAWKYASARMGCEALLTPTGQPYFDAGWFEAIADRFTLAPIECPRGDPVCDGPVDAHRIPLGHLESLAVVAKPNIDDDAQNTGPRIDLSIQRTLIDGKACELSVLVTNMTKGLTLSPMLELEVGLLPDHFPDKPRSWILSTSIDPIESYYSDQRVVGTIDVPCWGLETLTFRKVCYEDGETCRDLRRLPGTPFLDRASDTYLSVLLRNTPMYRRP